MKGTEASKQVILIAGSLIVGIIAISMVTNLFFSGKDAKKANEDATLGYQLVNIVNILSINERGNITQDLVSTHKIEVYEQGNKSKLKVGDREFDLLVRVKPTSFLSKKSVSVLKNQEGIEIVSLA